MFETAKEKFKKIVIGLLIIVLAMYFFNHPDKLGAFFDMAATGLGKLYTAIEKFLNGIS